MTEQPIALDNAATTRKQLNKNYSPEPSHGNRGQGQPKMLYPNYIGKLIDSETAPAIDEIQDGN